MAFFLIGYFSLAPIYWFGALGLLVLALSSQLTILRTTLFVAAAAAIALFLQRGSHGSPPYKITLTAAQPSGYELDVNSIGLRTNWGGSPLSGRRSGRSRSKNRLRVRRAIN